MKLFEIYNNQEDVIQQSFNDRVVSDLVADESQTGDTTRSEEVISNIRKQFPQLKDVDIQVSPNASRVRIMFGKEGQGERIEVPPVLRRELGEVLVLHELAHMLYTKDILTDVIVQHQKAPQAFTILRVLEDISIEKRLEQEFPQAIEVFKKRAGHIIPAYKKHNPSAFSSAIDQLFLYLRGYSKSFSGDPYLLKYAQQYLDSDDKNTKVDAVLNIVDRATKGYK